MDSNLRPSIGVLGHIHSTRPTTTAFKTLSTSSSQVGDSYFSKTSSSTENTNLRSVPIVLQTRLLCLRFKVRMVIIRIQVWKRVVNMRLRTYRYRA